MIESAIYCK